MRVMTGLCLPVLLMHCIVAHTGDAQLSHVTWGQCTVRLVENDGTQSSLSFNADSVWQHLSVPLNKFGSGSEFLDSPVSRIIIVPTGTGTLGSRIVETAEWFDQIMLGSRVIDDFEDGNYADWELTMATNGSYLRMQPTPHGPDSSGRCFNIIFGCGLDGSFTGWLTKSFPDVSLTTNDTLSFWIRGVTYVLNDVRDDHSPIPASVALYQNFPNPFNATTLIEYTIAEPRGQGLGAGKVRLVVYDVLGREVALLVNESLDGGRYVQQFDGSALPSGIYICRLTAGDRSEVKKMILAR